MTENIIFPRGDLLEVQVTKELFSLLRPRWVFFSLRPKKEKCPGDAAAASQHGPVCLVGILKHHFPKPSLLLIKPLCLYTWRGGEL